MMSKINKYFSVKDFVENICKEYKIKKEGKTFYFSAPRDIGKTYSAWEWGKKDFLKPNSKMAYVRIQDTQLKQAKAEFNNRYEDLIVSGNIIYKNEKYIEEYKGEEIEKFKKTDIVGYFLSINNYINAKSGEFANVDYIFIDEINEDTQNNIGLYKKFVNLVTTIIRKNEKTIIIILANRDTANSDFMVRWGIDERNEDEYLEDIVYRVSENIFYIEVSDNWYLNLENDKTLFHELASFDNAAARQLHGGYGVDFSKQVKNFRKWIEPTFKPKWGLIINQQKYFYGDFIFKNQPKKAFISAESKYYDNVKFYAVDTLSAAINDSIITDAINIKELYELLFYQVKNLTLYFDLFDTQTIFNLTLKSWYTAIK